MSRKMRSKSKMTPALVRDKVEECRFFLGLMQTNTTDALRFGRFMSAFLSAFGSVFQRLEHVIGGGTVKQLRENDADLAFLYDQRHEEVHRKGVVYHRVPSVRKIDRPQARSRLSSRLFAERGHRFHVTWDDRHFTYRLGNRPGDLVKVCSKCLLKIDQYVGEIEAAV